MEAAAAEGRLAEAAPLWWRERVDPTALRRRGWRWTIWTVGILVTFGAPAVVVVALSPWLAPVAALSLAHAWFITRIQAQRGARSVAPIPPGGDSPPERVALGLLGDLLDHEEHELLLTTGLAMQRGELGAWLVGERGAMMVRPGGRRVDCWCVKVSDSGELPPADRVAHLLLALREDERGFATVANLAFSGAARRVRRRLDEDGRAALDAARAAARRRG